MNNKKIISGILGLGGIIVSGILFTKGRSGNVVKEVKDVLEEVKFGGVPLSELNEIAKSVDSRDYCTIDQFGLLVLHYKSNRGHQNFQTQLDLDEAHKLFNLNGGPVFPGQRWSHASEFVKRVNEKIKFN